MPALLIATGIAAIIFILATFSKRSGQDCYISEFLYVDSRAFGKVYRDYVCITEGQHTLALGLAASLVAIGLIFLMKFPKHQVHVTKSHGPSQLPKKWQVLCEVDPDIASSAKAVRAIGLQWEHLLAEKYLVLGDKSYLDSLTASVIEQATQERQLAQTLESTNWAGDFYGFRYKKSPDGSILGETLQGLKTFKSEAEFQDYSMTQAMKRSRRS